MKVLQLGRYFPPHIGGIETVIFEIVEGLNERGIACDVLCSNQEKSLEINRLENYTVIRTASFGQLMSTSITPSIITQLMKIIDEYDIIHLHHPDPMATIALLLAQKKNKKIIVHWHSDIIRQRFALFFYKILQNALLRRADAVIVTSKNYLAGSQHLKKFTRKVSAVPIGIQTNFVVNENKLKALRDRFKNKTIVFSLGRHVYYKGFRYLVESASYLPDDFVVLIGGNGPMHEELVELVTRRNLHNKVIFTDRIPQNELASYFKACDIFCLPSIERTEAFGVVLLEAMFFGKPLITTDIPGSGVSFVNEHYKTGLSVPPKDAKALGDAIIKIGHDKLLYDKFSREGSKRFNALFTRDQMIDELVPLYHRLLAASETISAT